MSIRVVVYQDQPLKEALALLRERIRMQSFDDRRRRRWWGVEFAKKPGYIRWQARFFAKVRARKCERWFQATGKPYPLRW